MLGSWRSFVFDHEADYSRPLMICGKHSCYEPLSCNINTQALLSLLL